MTVILLISFIAVCYVSLRTGVRIGAGRMLMYIKNGFSVEVGDDEELSEHKECLKRVVAKNFWYNLYRDDAARQIEAEEIGRKLHSIAFADGRLFQQRWASAKDNEAEIRLDREDLKQISWLADYGLRVWTDQAASVSRTGDRLNEREAEKAKNIWKHSNARLRLGRTRQRRNVSSGSQHIRIGSYATGRRTAKTGRAFRG